MMHYTRDQFTVTFSPATGVAAAVVAAMLSQLKPGAVIEDTVTTLQDPHTGHRRLVITYREPAEKEA